MKKIFYLFAIACALVSCNGSDKNGKDVEPTGLSVPAEGTAGAKVTVVGKDIAADAKFYLANSESNTELAAEILASGAEVTLPYTLGEFALSLEQGGATYNVGKITVAVTGIVLPQEATAGEEITISANGFAADAAIFIGSEDANATFDASGCTLVIPSNAAVGENTVTVKQKGTEQELGKIVVKEAGVKKNITSFSVAMMGEPMIAFSVEYDNSGKPVQFDSYSITADGNKYTFAGDDLTWTFTVEGNRVASVNLYGKESNWEYDAEGHLVGFTVDDYAPYDLEYDSDGNSIFGVYENKSLACGPNYIDIANALSLSMMIEENAVIYYAAALLGWTGAPSTNLPSHFELDEDTNVEYTYAFDEDGFVTSVTDEMGLFEISLAY